MCIQVVERYAVCGCLYYKHQVDACSNYRKRGHEVRTVEVLVGYSCPKHSSSTLYRQPSARARRQAREEYQSDVPLDSMPIGCSPQRVTELSDDGQVVGSAGSSPGENTCPHHHLQSIAACPRECGWNVEQAIEEGDAIIGISRRQLHYLLRDSLISAFANLSHSVRPMAVTHSSDPCRGNNSHTTSDIIELDTLQSGAIPEASNSRTPQLPTANLDNLDEAEYPSIATCDTGKTKKRASIPPCYLLIFLGLLTVIGSLLPGLWRASLRNDLSGGFTLAQYILGVGIFVVGSMVAIHSKTCECWKKHNRVGQVVVDATERRQEAS